MATKKPKVPKVPTTRIAELYGHAPDDYRDPERGTTLARQCPFRGTLCNVTSNRHKVALLNLEQESVTEEERAHITGTYGNALPLGICSVWGKRQNELVSKPWILCPKRLLYLEALHPLLPAEVRALINIEEGRPVGVWSELKFRRNDPDEESSDFFEYTFDFLLMELDDEDNPIGPPYILEVMTSSTRGGGLTEHMVDVLMGREQRHLGGVVRSVYTPNYRQVFARMLAQFVTKSEIAEKWGGRAIWVLQDVLFDYITQTTRFNPDELQEVEKPNVFVEVYRLDAGEGASAGPGLRLSHHRSVRGRARLHEKSLDFTSLLGLGYAPDLEELRATLERTIAEASKGDGRSSWFKFTWGESTDPRILKDDVTIDPSEVEEL